MVSYLKEGKAVLLRIEQPEGTYFLQEKLNRTLRGEIRLFPGRLLEMPMWRGDAYLYYEIIYHKSQPMQMTIIDTFVTENLRRRGIGSQLVHLAEQQAVYHKVPKIRGHYLLGSEDFWTSKGYSLSHEGVFHIVQKSLIKEARRVEEPSPFELYNTQYSLKQLQEIAKGAGLSPSGQKFDLINRLIEKGALK